MIDAADRMACEKDLSDFISIENVNYLIIDLENLEITK